MSFVRSALVAAAFSISLPFLASAQQPAGQGSGPISVDAGYSRAMLPVAKVGGGYLTIVNAGDADRLVSVSSDRAGSVQIHQMKMDGGVMEMREMKDGIAVPAHGSLELKPGGYHLMFMDVAKPFKEGETIAATLVFEKAGPVDVKLAVGPVAGPVSGMAKPAEEHNMPGMHDAHGAHGK